MTRIIGGVGAVSSTVAAQVCVVAAQPLPEDATHIEERIELAALPTVLL
jgi:hypothetical protein